MTSHSFDGDEEMDIHEAMASESDLQEGLTRLSVSPPRDRHASASPSMWRTKTPSPGPFSRPPIGTPTTVSEASMPRTLSSPSLIESSPKQQLQPKRQMHSSPQLSPATATYIRRSAGNELTPITCNTTGYAKRGEYVDEDHVVVSPDDNNTDGLPLVGEHLALPSDPGFEQGSLKRRPSAGGGPPSLPPLAIVSERAKSVGNLHHHQEQEDYGFSDEYFEPVKFPSECQHYSFTSRQQFAESTEYAVPSHLKPYQPTTRREELANFPGEELDQIYRSIPVEERQYSFASIHLANHLNGSTTSYTDEEDDLVRGLACFEDDASLSSRGSSLCLPGEDDAAIPYSQVLRLNLSSSSRAAAGVMSSSHDSDNDADHEEEEEQRKPRAARKRKNAKERQAYEWLRSVESNDAAITEAASSKFLTSSAIRIPEHRRRSFHFRSSASLEEDANSNSETSR